MPNICPAARQEKAQHTAPRACRVLDHTQPPSPAPSTRPDRRPSAGRAKAGQSPHKATGGDALAAPLGSARDFVGRSKGGPTPFQLQRYAATLTNHKGLSSCFWLLAFGKQGVDVKGVPAGDGFDKVRLAGLSVCGSHLCPCCGPRVANQRTDEIRHILDYVGQSPDIWPVMVTLTVAHKRSDRLAGLSRGMKAALRRWKQHRRYKAARPQIFGTVAAFEATHGANGWHPHHHVILFIRAPSFARALRVVAGLRKAWAASLEAEGLECGRAGFHATKADRAMRYLAKWDTASEVGQSHRKAGKQGGRSPAELLRDGYAGDKRAAALWAEWAAAMKGLSLLRFSPGLKKRAGLSPVSDEEAAEPKPEDLEVRIHQVDGGHWNAAKAGGLSRDKLKAEGRKGAEAIRAYVAECVARAAKTVPRRSDRQESGKPGDSPARQGGRRRGPTGGGSPP